MKNPGVNQVLIVPGPQEKNIEEFAAFLSTTGCEIVIEHDLGTAINRAQNNRYDVIVLDAAINCVPLEHTIQILRDIDPSTKIIIKTNISSKELEAKARKEKIYYYHLDSFGLEDLKLAIESAINRGGDIPQSRMISYRGKKILMVDENDDFIEIHRTNLEKHHFKVDVCYDADEAYKKLKSQRPHAILLDLDIPIASDGFHFIEKLMDSEELCKVPILLFTPEMKSEKYHHILVKVKSSLPFWSYLEKPIKIEDVIPSVEKLLMKAKN